MTVREMPFRNCRGRSSEKLKAREDKIEEAKKQTTLKNRDEYWNSSKWKQSWIWLHPHLLLGETGAQTKRVSVLIGIHQPIGTAQKRCASVPIGSQLIGKAQIKRVRPRNGSHTTHGNEVIFIDPDKRIHGDENNFCF